jgi:Flp pilus assembly protein TadD
MQFHSNATTNRQQRRFNIMGDYKVALPLLQQAYEIAPHENGVDFELGFTHNALKNYREAAVVLQAAIQHDPQNYIHYRELGYSCLHAGKLELAEQC